MIQIHFSQNFQDFLIAHESGKSLCSINDPQGEALRWAYSLKRLPTNKIIIVGLGAGFHVAALADIHPDIEIVVLENREALVPIFKSQFPDIQDRVQVMAMQDSTEIFQSEIWQGILDREYFVLSFQECWGQQTEILSSIFAHATGRTAESVRFHFSELGMNLKSFHFDSAKLLSLPEVLPHMELEEAHSENQNIFKAIGELAHS